IVKLDANGNKQWEQTVGSPDSELYINTIEVTGDGGYVVGGSSTGGVSAVTGNCGKTAPNFGGYDFWLVRLNASGQRMWDGADGGFLVSGGSVSDPSGNKTAPHYGLQDYWVVRLDASGNKLWDHSYGGSSDDFGAWMAPMTDGGAVLAGYTDSPMNSGTRTAT